MSDEPIRIAQADLGSTPDACGCCVGTETVTPVATPNRPGLSAIAFRNARHGQLEASMLAGLSSADHLPLGRLGTRDADDLTIALIDAWACVCEVLGFYQERLANESYIATARERFSIGELARLIGYRLHPGSAAETDLVLLMDDPPGAEPDVTDLDVPAGTRIQSQPGPGEQPQVFETIEAIQARVAWNRLRPRLTRRILPGTGATSAWLAGSPTLRPGDALLFLGPERWDSSDPGFDTGSDQWDFRRVVSVAADAAAGRTLVTWDDPLDSVGPDGLRLFHLPERASLFGYNSPSPKLLAQDQLTHYVGTYTSVDILSVSIPLEWVFPANANLGVPLDAIYPAYRDDTWVVMTRGSGFSQAYRITNARDDAESLYTLSTRSTHLTLDTNDGTTTLFAQYRTVSVYGGSLELAFADSPLSDWVAGTEIELDGLAKDLPGGRRLIFSGRRAQVRLVLPGLALFADAPSDTPSEGDVLTLAEAPLSVNWFGIPFTIWQLTDAGGITRLAISVPGALVPIPAGDDAEAIAEPAVLERVEGADSAHSVLVLKEALTNAYDRASLAIHANLARAAHGEGVTEILGGGDPTQPFQRFALKQAPVTHQLAATETGVASTLTLRIDGVAWAEVPDLYARGPDARVFRTLLTDTGETIVELGDGRSGARPPPGRDNIVARFSRGLGRAGNVRAGALTMPLDRPLGLRETLNPLPASGGDDPQSIDDARINAPRFTLTLGRVVSLSDYRDYALGFPGIAKAEAHWVWYRDGRRVVVTVAGPDGVEVPQDGATHDALLAAYRRLGDPFVGVDLISYQPVHFRLALKVSVDPAHDTEAVLAAVETALRADFGFAARGFAEPVALSAIAGTAHRVAGVCAIDVDALYRTVEPQTARVPHDLLRALPGRQDAGTLLPAEILTLDPGPLDALELMA